MIEAKRQMYGGRLLRSSLELDVAKRLDSLHICWDYEPFHFNTPFGKYVPDFRIRSGWEIFNWLPNWIEVKNNNLIREFGKPFLPEWNNFGSHYTQANVWNELGICKSDVKEFPDWLQKPIALCFIQNEKVWIIGKNGPNSTIFVLKPSTTIEDESCVIFMITRVNPLARTSGPLINLPDNSNLWLCDEK